MKHITMNLHNNIIKRQISIIKYFSTGGKESKNTNLDTTRQETTSQI